jgi:hypothetical protein
LLCLAARRQARLSTMDLQTGLRHDESNARNHIE